MTQTIAAHFDGKVFVPDGPVELAAGQSVNLQVDVAADDAPKHAWMLGLGVDLPGAPPDLSTRRYGRYGGAESEA